jgi:hypothetical protein
MLGAAMGPRSILLGARRRRALLALLMVLPAAGAEPFGAEPVGALLEIDAELPAVVERLGGLEELLALALSPDRTRAAAAVSPSGAARGVVRLAAAGEPGSAEVHLPGLVRSLVFGYDSINLYVLVQRVGKRPRPETELLRIDVRAPGKVRREMSLPATAGSLTRAAHDRALLVGSQNEIRAILLPELRSGPLFRVPGLNLSLGAVPGTTRVVVGQRDRILVVDLADRPGLDGTPARASLPTDGPVTGLGISADGTRALARLGDGRLISLGLDPLRVSPESERPIAGEPESVASTPGAEPQEPTPPPARPPTAVAPETPGSPPPPPLPVPPGVPPSPQPGSASAALVQGTLEGPAYREVVAVVLLGPDNLLREAARVRPALDGTWWASGLVPGTYRVQLDSGGTRVVLSEPPFQTVLVSGALVTVPPFQVVGVR